MKASPWSSLGGIRSAPFISTVQQQRRPFRCFPTTGAAITLIRGPPCHGYREQQQPIHNKKGTVVFSVEGGRFHGRREDSFVCSPYLAVAKKTKSFSAAAAAASDTTNVLPALRFAGNNSDDGEGSRRNYDLYEFDDTSVTGGGGGGNNDGDGAPLLVKLVEGIASFLSRPTPGRDDLAIAFPLSLVLILTVSSTYTASILTAAFFVAFAASTRIFSVSDLEESENDSSEPRTTDATILPDFLSLAGAIVVANLLGPSLAAITSSSLGGLQLLGLAGIAIVFALLVDGSRQDYDWDEDGYYNDGVGDVRSKQGDRSRKRRDDDEGQTNADVDDIERRWMERWDRKFRRSQKKKIDDKKGQQEQ